jgi:hypothetical protein
MTKIVFTTKVHKLNGNRLSFNIPKRVIEFYRLEVPKGGLIIRGKIEWFGYATKLPDLGTKLYNHNGGIRGVIPRWTTMPEAGTLVQFRFEVVE